MSKTKKWSEPKSILRKYPKEKSYKLLGLKEKKVGRPKGKGRYYKVTGVTPTGERVRLGYTSSKTAFTRYSRGWTTKGYRLEFKTLYRKEKSKGGK